MELRIIIQPPYALLIGIEAINKLDNNDDIKVYGLALHFLFISLEFVW